MPDYHHGSPEGPWKHPPAYPPQSTQYSPGMPGFDRAHPFQPDFYSSMHYPSIANAPPHMSTVGRTDSSGSSGDKILGGNPGSQVPQLIGGNMQPGPQVFRTPPVGYGEYPYNAQFHHGVPSSVQPMPTYSHYPPAPYPQQTWSAMTPPSFVQVEYISELGPEDVLSGRGGATNSYKGNRSFRSLVKKYQPEYLKAKKRDKPAVASIIVELIRKKGGRFLRRCDNKHSANGNVLWVDIGDDRAREKTCQALREGAPELRRRTLGKSASRSYSYDEDESVHERSPMSSRSKPTDPMLQSPSSSIERTASNMSKDGGVRWSAEYEETDDEQEGYLQGFPTGNKMRQKSEDGPIRIRPWAMLLPDRGPVEAIDLDHLTVFDRDMYLRDFLPPDPSISNSKSWNTQSPLNSPCSAGYGESPTAATQFYESQNSPSLQHARDQSLDRCDGH